MKHPNTSPLTLSQANFVLDAFERSAPETVSSLILTAPCLKEYKTDKVSQ